ncbi:MAG TPA: hypothetical protein VEA99_12410 [Gemmatimonadaceae bacterium]|nr:hypothetical protein [Gemmatimonadaceae bacterium]
MRFASRSFGPAALALSLLAAACSTDVGPLAPTSGIAPIEAAPLLDAAAAQPGATLLSCPSSTALVEHGIIDERGGVLHAAGHALIVPRGALRKATRFTLEVPASPYLEVDISADGRKDFKFKSNVLLRLSYARCATPPDAQLVGWWIDGTRRKLGEMPTVVDPFSQSVWITTDHLSGYAIAYRNGRGSQGEEP